MLAGGVVAAATEQAFARRLLPAAWVCDKFMGKRSLSTHPHPALPLKGRKNRERSLKGRENRERLRPKGHKT
jgi:hypothetical protein